MIKRKTQLAQINYQPNHLEILGPLILVEAIESISILAENPSSRLLAESMFTDECAKFHVICATTKQKIPLDELRYWCVNDQKPYIKDVRA